MQDLTVTRRIDFPELPCLQGVCRTVNISCVVRTGKCRMITCFFGNAHSRPQQARFEPPTAAPPSQVRLSTINKEDEPCEPSIRDRIKAMNASLNAVALMDTQQPRCRIPQIKFRVLIIGRANAGKTSILQKVCDTTESPVVYRRGNEEVRGPTFLSTSLITLPTRLNLTHQWM